MESVEKDNMVRRTSLNPLSDLTRVEDYLEVIYGLIQEKGYARPADIAERLEVKAPSVTGMLQRLHGMGLIVYERYRGLTLTSKGERLAKSVQQNHSTLINFLRILGVEERTVQLDAEGIEHHVHKTTIDRIKRFVDYAAQHPSWFKVFEDAGNRRLNKG
jgi:Mn-dependent DtxR family transcriptional regulator